MLIDTNILFLLAECEVLYGPSDSTKYIKLRQLCGETRRLLAERCNPCLISELSRLEFSRALLRKTLTDQRLFTYFTQRSKKPAKLCSQVFDEIITKTRAAEVKVEKVEVEQKDLKKASEVAERLRGRELPELLDPVQCDEGCISRHAFNIILLAQAVNRSVKVLTKDRHFVWFDILYSGSKPKCRSTPFLKQCESKQVIFARFSAHQHGEVFTRYLLRQHVRLYWCEDLNVPVLDPGDAVDKCGRFVETRLAEPADPRPAFPADVEITREAVVNEFGDPRLAELLIPADEVVVLNKIPGYADQADEVVVRGRIVGHRFYDVLERRWRFRPLYEAVSLMLAERRGFWAVVDMAELPAGYDVHPDRVIEGSLPGIKFRHVAVSSRDGKFHGVAKLFRGRRLHIVKSWRARGPLPPGRPSTIKDAAELNRGRVTRLAERAVRLVRSVAEEYRLPVVASYSGGKDSLVALDIVVRSGVKFCVYFNDTGLEPRETYENLRAVGERYGVEIIVGSAGDRFWRAARLFGPPARDYRWCCKVIKLGPTTEALRGRFPGGFISVVGQRGAESFQRSRLPPVSRSRWVAGAIVVAPLQEWAALDVWFYIFLHGLPYNPAYERGFDRLGCVICPANELAELELVRRHYPEVYRRLNAILREHFSDKEIELGLWRWRGSVPGDMARWVGARSAGRRLPVRVVRYGARVEVELDAEPNAETLAELLKILSKARDAREEGAGGRAVRIERAGNVWKVTASDAETALNAAGLLVRSAICGKCDLCIYWCPARALEKAGTGLRVDESKCTGCLLCNEVCPSVQYLVRRSAALTARRDPRTAGSRDGEREGLA